MSKSMSMSGEEAKIALGKAFEAHDRMVIRVAALAAQVDVLTRALRQACYDGWADGEGAMARYIEQAERAGGAR